MPPYKPGSAIGHTARYLADKIRAKKAAQQEKRKAEDPLDKEDDHPLHAVKRVHKDTGETISPDHIEDLKIQALKQWTEQMQPGTDAIYRRLYGQHWEEGKKYELEKLSQKQAEHKRQQAELEAAHPDRSSKWKKSHAAVTDSGIYRDDYDPRY